MVLCIACILVIDIAYYSMYVLVIGITVNYLQKVIKQVSYKY